MSGFEDESTWRQIGLVQHEDIAVSGGVQVGAADNLFLGVGYNSVRGVNGQVGIRF